MLGQHGLGAAVARSTTAISPYDVGVPSTTAARSPDDREARHDAAGAVEHRPRRRAPSRGDRLQVGAAALAQRRTAIRPSAVSCGRPPG